MTSRHRGVIMKSADLASPLEPVAPLPAAVIEIGKIHFEGNIIPHPWYRHITFPSGKPDLPAIIILAEIVYWYRPYQTLNQCGKPLLRKRFDGDMFQCSAAYYEKKFGLTKDQTRKALKRLEDGGYIRREYRDIVRQGIRMNCVMFVEPVPPAILAITDPAIVAQPTSVKATPTSPVGAPTSPVGDPNTEITTKISTTTTTPNPSSFTERAAEPKTARGGGNQDQTPKDWNGNHGKAALKPSAEKPVVSEKAIDGQRPELAFPAKLTAREHEDIAAQAHPLPTEVAQQMLDVIQARIQNGPPIRTNPAAVFRGIVRKYQVDPSNFDPSSGFHIAEARQRRAEAETRFRIALEPRCPAPAPLPLPARENRPKGRPEGLQKLLQAVSPLLARPARQSG